MDGSTRRWIGGGLAVVLVALAVAASLSGPALDESTPEPQAEGDPGKTAVTVGDETVSSSDLEAASLAAVNERRHVYGLETLEQNETVASVARAHSQDMVDRGYFGHEDPDGVDPVERFEAVGDFCLLYGETIARTDLAEHGGDVPTVAAEVVEEWMASRAHEETILEKNQQRSWDTAGIGVAFGEDGWVYVTANFCHSR